MNVEKTLEKLSNAHGVSGREFEVKELMKNFLSPYVDEIKSDKLGNLIGIVTGKKNAPKIMLAAHMDEIGLMIKTISKKGFLQFTKIGGIDDRILLGQNVIIVTEDGPINGIIGSKPPHIQNEEERKRIVKTNELFIDVGAENDKDVEKIGVKIGDPVSFDIKFNKINKDIVIGKGFDDRVGCAVLLETIKQLEKTECTIYVVGTIQEEVGLRGATTASFRIDPDVGIAIDVTVAGGVPGVKEVEAPIRMRNGPSITIADAGFIAHPKILQLLINSAKEKKIKYQLETGLSGTTDAARMSLAREGIPCGVISIPTRYIHSPVSMVSLRDIRESIKLTLGAVEEIPDHFK